MPIAKVRFRQVSKGLLGSECVCGADPKARLAQAQLTAKCLLARWHNRVSEQTNAWGADESNKAGNVARSQGDNGRGMGSNTAGGLWR